MRNTPFSIGDTVRLANFNTRFKWNGIAEERWGKEYEITQVNVGYGANEVAAYLLKMPGNNHVVHSMLEEAGGPW